MADQNRTIDIDRLSDAVHSLRKSLECTICLEFIKDPIKTRCGHSFCKACIWKVLQTKKTTCPLCQKSLTRRNVSKDDHMQTCIERFTKLVSAIQADTNIDILSHLKHPRDTRESCSYTDISESNKKKSSHRSSARQASANSNRQTDKASTSRKIEHDDNNSRDELLSQVALSDPPVANHLSVENDDNYCKPDVKVRTWLHSFSGESTAELEERDANETRVTEDETSSVADNNSKSSRNSEMRLVKGRRSNRGRKRKNSSERSDDKEDNASRTESETQKPGEEKDIDFYSSGLKYSKIHAKIRKRENKRDEIEEKRSNVDEASKQDESATDASDRANTSSANWSRVIEFGKEMRDKKKKVKKLNVHTEKNKPKILESIVLTPKSKIDPARLPTRKTDGSQSTCRNETNAFESMGDGGTNRRRDAGDRSLRVSTPLKQPKIIRDVTNTSTSDHSALETSYITLEENRKIRIVNLNNDQVNEILGFGVDKDQSQNQRAPIDHLSQSPSKLRVLTPEKVNEQADRGARKTIDCNRSALRTSAEDQNLGSQERDDGDIASRTSGEIEFHGMRTPKKSRLSLRRKLTTDDNKNVDSPAERSHEKHVIDDRVDSPENVAAPDRLARARRNVSTQIDEDQPPRAVRSATIATTSSSLRSKDEDDRGIVRRDERLVSDLRSGRSKRLRRSKTPERDFRVRFVQLGSMNRRRQTKYYYLGKINRERLLAAEIGNVTVYNMQQSISKSEIKYVANKSLSRATSPLNDSQESVIAMETARCFLAKSSNRAIENPELSASSSACGIAAATSTPRIDIDRTTSRSSIDANARSNEPIEDKENKRCSKILRDDLVGNAIRDISCVSLRSSVRILSPDKDSQLKFLDTDSPMSQRAFKRGTSTHHRRSVENIAEDYFSDKEQSTVATFASKKQDSSSSEIFEKKKKRKRCITIEGKFEDVESGNDLSGDVVDDLRSTNDRNGRDKSSKDVKSDVDANKRRRLSSADDKAIVDSDERRALVHKKFRRIIRIPSSESESPVNCCPARDDREFDQASPANVVARSLRDRETNPSEEPVRNVLENRNGERNEKITSRRSSAETIIRIPCDEESASSYQSSRLANEENNVANQNSCATKESQMFESNSIFHSDNLEYIIEESLNRCVKAPDKFSNNDIINRVLQIDRQSNSDARHSPNDGTRQRDETGGGGGYLLQDNFDEIIANVELPQSEKMTPSSLRADSNRARQKTSKCPAMTDESSRGAATQEMIPVMSASSHDIFEQSDSINDRNVDRPVGASGNSNKENVALGRKSYATDDVSSDRKIKHGKEKSFDRGDGVWIDAERHGVDNVTAAQNRNLSDDQSKDSQNDSIMNVTRDQLRLQIFEEDLFGVISSRSPTKATTTRDDADLLQEASTPRREKRRDLQDKNVLSPKEQAEENDVVENTPESKMKKSGSRSFGTLESRRNISLSFMTPKSTDRAPVSVPNTPVLEKIPLCQSTPRDGHLDVLTGNRRTELAATRGLVSPTIGRTPEDNRQIRSAKETTPCVVCSSLTVTQTKAVKDFAAEYKLRFADRFDPKIITHVIVNTTGKENAAKSTLKYLQGVAHRKWIVSYRWVEDCVRKQKILDEEPYEATTFCDGIFPAPRKSRLRETNLFEGFVFVCIGPYDNVTPAEYQDLLLATGAMVVDSLDDLDKKEGLKGILIQDDAYDNKVIENWYRTVKAAPILVDWIVDCIGRYKLLKLASYIHFISPQDCYALGYPRDLLEDEEYSDDDLLIIK
ncbi:uncharacterized protein LOC109855601 [Pseudomyrmex gracilis]|uniref:uncharacterized protein LOC109855601 n=1 Tax=Pseudomyrmex gracilis TaxID=219809 RepID=UPI00099592CF|nr:uncharacterized protein LOC109855601 [Pseudomyrmex gracilis]